LARFSQIGANFLQCPHLSNYILASRKSASSLPENEEDPPWRKELYKDIAIGDNIWESLWGECENFSVRVPLAVWSLEVMLR
jgi:hypothetical protein